MAFPPKKTKKKTRKATTYMPDESGHMVEWVGDHPVGVPRKKEEEDDENNEGNFVMGKSGG